MTVSLIDSSAYNERLQLLRNKPQKINIPQYIQRVIFDNRMYDIDDENERARCFLQEMFKFKMLGATIASHFRKLKPLLFPNTTIRPNSLAFDSKRSAQTRVPDFECIDKLARHLKEVTNHDGKWPILLAFYTGLRLSEVCRLQASHIVQLTRRQPVIPLSRKRNTEWTVLYFDEFNSFVAALYARYADECAYFISHGIDGAVFKMSPRLIHYLVRTFYAKSNGGQQPPYGFGIHAFRYYVGTKLMADNKLDIARIFLGHKHLKTTERYVVADNAHLERVLTSINNKSEFYARVLSVPQQQVDEQEIVPTNIR